MNLARSWWFGGFVHFADQGNKVTDEVVHVGGNYPVASKLDCMVLYFLIPFHPLPEGWYYRLNTIASSPAGWRCK